MASHAAVRHASTSSQGKDDMANGRSEGATSEDSLTGSVHSSVVNNGVIVKNDAEQSNAGNQGPKVYQQSYTCPNYQYPQILYGGTYHSSEIVTRLEETRRDHNLNCGSNGEVVTHTTTASTSCTITNQSTIGSTYIHVRGGCSTNNTNNSGSIDRNGSSSTFSTGSALNHDMRAQMKPSSGKNKKDDSVSEFGTVDQRMAMAPSPQLPRSNAAGGNLERASNSAFSHPLGQDNHSKDKGETGATRCSTPTRDNTCEDATTGSKTVSAPTSAPPTPVPPPTHTSRSAHGHNYAAPHTPIASAKRPRHKTGNHVGSLTPNATYGTITPTRQQPAVYRAGEQTPVGGRGISLMDGAKFSPMHPPTSIRLQASHRRGDDTNVVDDHGTLHGMDEGVEDTNGEDGNPGGKWGMLFSPVLNFLGAAGSKDEDELNRAGSVPPHPPAIGLKMRPSAVIEESLRDPNEEDEEEEDVVDDLRQPRLDDDGDVRMTTVYHAHENNHSRVQTLRDCETGRIHVEQRHSTPYEKTAIATATVSSSGEETGDESPSPSPSPSSAAATIGTTASDREDIVTPSAGMTATEAGESEAVVNKEGAVQSVPSTETADGSANSAEAGNSGEESEEEDEFNPYLFIKHLPPYHTVAPPWALHRFPTSIGRHSHSLLSNGTAHHQHHHNQWAIPPKDRSAPAITLVLDLDETLVHCTVDDIPDADLTFPVLFGGTEYSVRVKLRPHLSGFLRRVSRKFEVVVFTASQKVYANELLDRIDPGRRYIRHRMFRESCLPVEGNYLKDLNALGPSRRLEHMVLVDNSPHAFGYQVDNGIPIESWFDDPNDTELLKLEEFLQTLHGTDDVRPLVRAKFGTYLLVQHA